MYQEKAVFALVGVIVGFLANKIYDIAASILERRKIHKGLLEELESLDSDLTNLKAICENRLEQGNSYHEGRFPRKIQSPIYNKYYADICLYLNRSQRCSFEQIYVIVEELNQFISRFFKERCDKGNCSSDCKATIATNYASVCDLIFLVNNHIKYEKQPIISSQIEVELGQHRKDVDDHLRKYGLQE
tara:strand:- start:7 stop:570 length:564 start_codon:yes stop_codon:yes gene_type:complete